jgi:hypothetical protein
VGDGVGEDVAQIRAQGHRSMIVADREPGIVGSMSRDYARGLMAAAALPLFTRKSTAIFGHFCTVLEAARSNLKELEPKIYPHGVFKKIINYFPSFAAGLLVQGSSLLTRSLDRSGKSASSQVREFALCGVPQIRHLRQV